MLQLHTIEAPEHWASALVNGDFSGLTTAEAMQVQAWRERELPADASICGCADEARFTWHYRLFGGDADGGSVLEYQYLTKG